jgi:hypothetical protein
MMAAKRLNAPIIDGTKSATEGGKVFWAKFAVPVIVLMMITGSVKLMLQTLLIW